ncbi:MAG: hypothetical protein DKT66_23255 [Candidatus Melainabacteria bacterium]|nr:MAG: hypothetical protein DKT66_23255 [Candidatus Melainabacteria bacterium]
MSHYHYLTDEEINASIANDSKTLRACLLDTHSNHLVLTIPENSPFLETDTVALIVQLLSSAGMKPKLYGVSESQSVQIFLSFSEPVKTAEMTASISSYLRASGFTPGENNLIVHSTELPWPLPLQPGFSWLNDRLETRLSRDSISIPAATAMFLHDLDSAAVSPNNVREKLNESLSSAPLSNIEPAVIEAICELAVDSDLNAFQEQLNETVVETEADAPVIETAESILEDSFVESDEVTEPESNSPSIESEEGTQLLLFPIIPNGISALPKGRPKREKRARSNLPDSSQAAKSEQEQVFSTPLLAELANATETKEVIQNTS